MLPRRRPAGQRAHLTRRGHVLPREDYSNAYPNPSGDQPHLDYFSLPGNERFYTFRAGSA
jgi:hypothetical protein